MQEKAAAEVAPAPEGAQGSSAVELISNVSEGLGLVGQIMSSMPNVAPEDMEEIMGMSEKFRAIISKYMEGGSPASSKTAKGKAVPMQTAQGRPMNPAGM